jgi:hypothetical protein
MSGIYSQILRAEVRTCVIGHVTTDRSLSEEKLHMRFVGRLRQQQVTGIRFSKQAAAVEVKIHR